MSTTPPLDRIHQLLDAYADPQVSLAAVLCDNHPADALAYTIVEPDLSTGQLTYGRLREQSERFATALSAVGVRPGDRVATLMGKSADYLITLLGIWRLGAVHVPLFTAFAPPAIALRLQGSQAKVVVCDDAQRPKLDPGEDIPAQAPWRVIVSHTGPTTSGVGSGDLVFSELLQERAAAPAAALGGQAPMIHIYTSGTTGRPKGVVVPTVALAGFQGYAELALGLLPDDVYWCAADPGWAYGLYFGVLASLTTGVPSVLAHAGFSAELTWQILAQEQVTNFTAAPTVYRSMRAANLTPPTGLRLRALSSAGEPLTPEVIDWSQDTLGLAVHDHYGQTEAGMLVNNHHHPALQRPLRPGSMGHPMPGWAVTVLDHERDQLTEPGTLGRVAVDIADSPLHWFSGYIDAPDSGGKFTRDGRWYLTGDVARADDAGYFHFSARDDDVIIMAGYRIGPFEVESVLATHPAVAECAVIATPDEVRGEVLESFIVLRDGFTASPELTTELQQWVKTKFAAHAYPREVHYAAELPKTPSGKVQRYLLRQQRLQDQPKPASAVPAEPTD
jgi:acetyl-CoA synthetase